MRYVTNLIVNLYNVENIDFMGYKIDKKESLTFHHLIVPRRANGQESVANGVCLTTTSHEYLHRIEHYDIEKFCLITSEMIDEKIKGEINIDNLKRIKQILEEFEEEYGQYSTSKGKPIIKNKYKKERAEWI